MHTQIRGFTDEHNAAPATLTIQQDYGNFSTRELASGEQQTLGFFTRTDKPTNVGFRNVIQLGIKDSEAVSRE